MAEQQAPTGPGTVIAVRPADTGTEMAGAVTLKIALDTGEVVEHTGAGQAAAHAVGDRVTLPLSG